MFHTIIWKLGILGSFGAIRVFAGIAPLTALIALDGFNFFSTNTIMKKQIMIYLLTLTLMIYPFFVYQFPIRPNVEQKIAMETCAWVNKISSKTNKIYFQFPIVALYLNIDPYDKKASGKIWELNPEFPSESMEKNSLIIWDKHFANNEGHVSLDNLKKDPSLIELKAFSSNEKYIDIKGEVTFFEMHVFQKK